MTHPDTIAQELPAYACTSDRYCATPDTFDTVDEFVATVARLVESAENSSTGRGSAPSAYGTID